VERFYVEVLSTSDKRPIEPIRRFFAFVHTTIRNGFTQYDFVLMWQCANKLLLHISCKQQHPAGPAFCWWWWLSVGMSRRSNIRSWTDPVNTSCVYFCNRHGQLHAELSRQGRWYHSCSSWDASLHRFSAKPAIHPSQACTVRFVFCSDHRVAPTVARHFSTNSSSTVLSDDVLPDVSQHDARPAADTMDVDPADVDSIEVPLSRFFTPPSPVAVDCAETNLLPSQRELIQQFSQLMDDIHG
jgi:hypothetical protein